MTGTPYADTIKNNASYVTISAGDDNDSVFSVGDKVLIDGGAGKNTLEGVGSNLTINGGNDNDTIYASDGDYLTITGGYGADTISGIFYTSSIAGGADADKISLRGDGSGNTIAGGTGNDTVYSSLTSGMVYSYNYGDGNDSIIGWTAKDTLKVTNATWTSVTSGQNTIINISDGSTITLAGYVSTGTTTPIDTWINHTTSYDSVIGTASVEKIKNSGTHVTVSASTGNDSLSNTGNSLTAYMGAGNDSVYNNGSYAKIYGDDGADTIYNYHSGDYSYIDGGSGNDSIYATDGDYLTITGGAGADTISGKFWSSSINGGADTDKISLYGGNSCNTVVGATGNDTVYSSITNGVFYQYAKGDGNDSIIGWTSYDTMSITGGSHTTSTGGNDVIVSITGGAKVTLSGAKGKTINVVSETQPPTSTVTAQEVIKKFMKSLDTTANSGVEALDEAVRVASGGYFKNIQSAITSMVNDCKSSSSGDAFLKNKCGINLSNENTGAITGYDASGSKTAKTKYSIVPESGNLDTKFTDTSFPVNGVTFTLNDPKYSLTDPLKKYIWQGFKTWWAKSALDLIAESYGDNYGFGSKSSAYNKEYTFVFTNAGNEYVAAADSYGVYVNMDYYKNIIVGNKDGISKTSALYLDRVLAHELTHAVMMNNVGVYSSDNTFGTLPQFITEGMAELTHGVDDTRKSALQTLAGNSTKLKNTLNLSDLGTGDNDVYAGGYMFLRYLAKQGSEHYGSTTVTSNSNAKALTAQSSNVSLSGNVLTVTSKPSDGVIDLTKYSTSVRKVDASKLTAGVMIIGNTYANSIKGGKVKNITLIDKYGTESTKKYTASMTFSSSNLATSSDILFDDENFLTADNQLDAITKPVETNYSVASVDLYSNFGNFAQIDELVTAQGYSAALNKNKK